MNMEKGIKVEMEHKDLIVKMLKEAGKEVSEEMIRKVAAEIARVHYEEDPEYYDKLEKIEAKNALDNGFGVKEFAYSIKEEGGRFYIYSRPKQASPYGTNKWHIVTSLTFPTKQDAEKYIRDNLR